MNHDKQSLSIIKSIFKSIITPSLNCSFFRAEGVPLHHVLSKTLGFTSCPRHKSSATAQATSFPPQALMAVL